jgi:hypothetical protein
MNKDTIRCGGGRKKNYFAQQCMKWAEFGRVLISRRKEGLRTASANVYRVHCGDFDPLPNNVSFLYFSLFLFFIHLFFNPVLLPLFHV